MKAHTDTIPLYNGSFNVKCDDLDGPQSLKIRFGCVNIALLTAQYSSGRARSVTQDILKPACTWWNFHTAKRMNIPTISIISRLLGSSGQKDLWQVGLMGCGRFLTVQRSHFENIVLPFDTKQCFVCSRSACGTPERWWEIMKARRSFRDSNCTKPLLPWSNWGNNATQ